MMLAFKKMAALVACALSYLLATPVARAHEWPDLPLPKAIQTFDIGQQITVNGLPMRVRGFLSPMKTDRLAQTFRETWGSPVVENRLGKQLVLGQLRGEYYLSVQLEAAGKGSRGVLAVTHLKAAYEAQDQTKIDSDRWLSKMPSGSHLVSQMISKDSGRLSTHLLIENSHSENLNRDRLKSLLLEDGLILQHEGTLGDSTAPQLSESVTSSKTLFFKGPGKEAMATIHRNNSGRAIVVLNIVTQIN